MVVVVVLVVGVTVEMEVEVEVGITLENCQEEREADWEDMDLMVRSWTVRTDRESKIHTNNLLHQHVRQLVLTGVGCR